MNVQAFRHFYNYHFAENRKVWEHVALLTFEQFNQPIGYSRGSIREQLVHLIDAEDVWFSELRGAQPSEPLPETTDVDDREAIRALWDTVERNTRAYLANLEDDFLFTKPITDPEEDKDLIVWQVLLHVVNHATDHRAQLLRALHDLGVDTKSQDYIFYVYENQL
ncbi:MAG TPA: DinB family protein [Anaerolineales bacterium]|nr:DinB family protein [Anaerolineales bacterium]